MEIEMGHGEGKQDRERIDMRKRAGGRPAQSEMVGDTLPWPLCACGCGEPLTKRQKGKRGKYRSLSCSRHAALLKPSVRAAVQRSWAKAAETNRRKHYAKVRAEVLDVCRDVLQGAEPTPEMIAIAVRMRVKGYNSGWRARWSREKRRAA
jgi:hypothetical protein